MTAAENPRVRLGVLGVLIVSLFAALFARLWYLQVMTTQEFRAAAIANQTRVIIEPAPRGRILDRSGNVLVENRLSRVVTVDRAELPPMGTPERTELLDRLARELRSFLPGDAFSVEAIEARLADVRFSPYTPVPVADDVTEELEVYLREHHADFGDAVTVTSASVRSYPYGRVGSHVLGYIGAINEEELAERRGDSKQYQLGDLIGKTGVERAYETELRGQPGERVLEVDARGNTVREISYKEPIPGNDVMLTLDARMQAITEQALAEELQDARDRRNSDGTYNTSPAGSAVVLAPGTGEVLAMASFPDYDPREFTKPIPTETWEWLNDPANHYPLNNRALQGLYAPGSTFKLISAYAGLASGAIEPNTSVTDTGSYRVPGCRGEQCTFGSPRANGRVDLPRAISVSSDVYFYQLGARFWIERDVFQDPIQDAAVLFGLGAETGIPLPGEQAGFVPTPENKRARHEANPEAFPFGDWYTGDNVNLSIGQGDLVATPLQIANAYGAFANGGSLLQPNIALQILDGTTGETVRTLGPRVAREIPFEPAWYQALHDGFVGVIESEQGTAYGSFLGFPGSWTLAGKTGTAQVSVGSDTALFVGMLPADATSYVGAAVLENSGFGSVAAAPVIRRVFETIADPEEAPTLQPGGILSSPVPAGTDTGASQVRD